MANRLQISVSGLYKNPRITVILGKGHGIKPVNDMNLPVIIKKKQGLYPLYAAISIAMLGIALLFLFFPFIPLVTNAMSSSEITVYMIIGGICTLFFAFTSSVIIFSIVSPPTAIKITKNGIYEYTVAGVGAGFIPKEAIVSLKKFGSDGRQFLGIRIDTKYLDVLSNDKKARLEISSNINSGLPAIIIRQNDIKMPINELLNIIMTVYADMNTEAKQQETKLDSVMNVQDVEPITITDDELEVAAEEQKITDHTVKQDEICTVDEQDPTISYKPFSLPSTEDEYAPILVNPEKPRIKTVDDLLAQLNIKPVKSSKEPVKEEFKTDSEQ